MAVNESDQTPNGSGSTDPAMSFRARHWMVGTNVMVMVFLALVLFCFVQWFGFTWGSQWRADMTSTGVNSLRDGTVDLVRKLEKPITLTSLYHTTDMDEENQKFLQSVKDLFALYQSVNRSNVETASINPLKDHNQRNKLLERLREKPKYTEEAAKHIELIESFSNELYPKLKTFLDEERASVDELIQLDQAFAQLATATTILQSFEVLGRRADDVREDVRAALNDEIPQYSNAANRIKDYAAGSGSGDGVKGFLSQIQEKGPDIVKAAEGLTEKTRTFFNEAKQRYTEMMAQLADLETKTADLPNLKLEDLRRDLGQQNVIVVETKEDARIVSFRDVWPTKQQGGPGGSSKFEDHYFAGESQITSAILQMTSTDKPAVVFAKYGGPPVFTSMGRGNPMQRQPPGQYPNLKKTLERLNYMVKEWDLQASKDSPPTFDPEPSRIIYVALDPDPQPPQTPNRMPMMQQPGQFDPAARAAFLAKIGDNGRALFLGGWGEPSGMIPIPQTYEYADYLKTTWGIDVQSSFVVLSMMSHEPGKWIPARSNPFHTRKWTFNDNVITESIKNLPGSFLNAAPIKRTDTVPGGVEITDLVTVNATDEVWGESDLMGLRQEFQKLNYSKGPGDSDVSGPFPIAVSATRGDQKIVVVASNQFAIDNVAGQQSLMLGASGAVIQKVNPANEPFFVNCIQWLNDNEEQIGLGAVTTFAESRLSIQEGSTLTAWRWFAWAGWPAMALFVGVGAWFVRRR